MTDKESPTDVLKRMLQDAAEADTVDDIPLPGTYAKQYGDSVKGDLTAENVEAFLYGSAVCNLLVQEAILRVTSIAKAQEVDRGTLEAAYTEGVNDGGLLVAQIVGGVIDGLLQGMIEGPAIQRAFNGIVANF